MSHTDEHARWRGAMDAGALSPAEMDGMLAHADQCPQCAPALRDFAARVLVTQAPAVILEAPRAADLRARILAAAAHRPAVASRKHWPKHRHAAAFTRTGGWMAAAAMAVALLTHHAFHEPLRAGWMAAALFAILAFGLGVHAIAQRRRLAELERRLHDAGDGRRG